MSAIHKTFDIKVLKRRKDGGRILINTAGIDRDNDRVHPTGAQVDNYMRNPVVQWAHDYRSPWATIGKTNELGIAPEGIVADFELRPAANEHDPQNIVRLLWDGNWIRTASIGFMPKGQPKPNDVGGRDFTEWELLEWSLVPIPSNQDALRLAVKGLSGNGDLARLIDDQTKEPAAQQQAWVRRLTVESEMGQQTLLACFRRHIVDVPEDATLLQFDPVTGDCADIPHPEAGKAVVLKDALFVPPLEFSSDGFQDAVYVLSGREQEDAAMVADQRGLWSVLELSEVLANVNAPEVKSVAWGESGFGVDILTQRGIDRARRLVLRSRRREKALLTKRGRVLSAANEKRIRDARDNLDEVLKQLDEETGDEPERPRERSLVPKPFANEHACRLRDPDDFDPASFRRMERESDGKKYAVIMGRLKGETTLTEQAFRYPREVWTVAEARAHCRSHDGIEFTPATGDKGQRDMHDMSEHMDGMDEAIGSMREHLDAMRELVDESGDDEERGLSDPEVSKEELESGIITKFSGSPRNPFGTHSSYQFKGGQDGYKRSWRLHFSQINGGATTGAASGPIRGTVRRTEMIGATMGCDLPSTDSIAARDGPPSPLEGTFPEKPGDYGLDKWKEPETDADREGVKLSCSDLAIIKRAALAEIKRRAEDRERDEGKRASEMDADGERDLADVLQILQGIKEVYT